MLLHFYKATRQDIYAYMIWLNESLLRMQNLFDKPSRRFFNDVILTHLKNSLIYMTVYTAFKVSNIKVHIFQHGVNRI